VTVSLRSIDSHWWGKIAVSRLWKFYFIWYGSEDMVPRMFVMLYVASLLCQSHRAGAKAQKNRATQPDDVIKKDPQCLLFDGARQVIWLGNFKPQET
jgi:hypothetical protein